MGMIRVNRTGTGFEDAATGEAFVPVGSNYCSVMAGINEGGYCGCVFPLFGFDEHTEKTALEEARRAFGRMAALNLNVVRLWLEPDHFFPDGLRLDPHGAECFDRLLEVARESGIRLSVGMHLLTHESGWKLHNFQPPHRDRLLGQIHEFGLRWGQEEQIFSWTIVGEGNMPWYTAWMHRGWADYLRYWYNDDLKSLHKAWGNIGVDIRSFEDAPPPPRNIGCTLPLGAVSPGNLDKLPHDPWAGSRWRYDWRLYMEEIGTERVSLEVQALRSAGARQMTTVGNNSWIFPNLPAGLMAGGYNPYFYANHVDYLCQHNYPAPQCLPGGNGDPLDSEENLRSWLNANNVMGGVYRSLGKPVVLEEWGWYGGGETSFLRKLPFRSEEEQRHYCERMMTESAKCFAGWIYWMWRDQPKALDLTNRSGLYAADGNRLKLWGKRYGELAAQFRKTPPVPAKPTKTVEMPMLQLLTCDRTHESWLQEQMAGYDKYGPYHFKPVFERRPQVATTLDLTGRGGERATPVETPMGTSNT